MTTDSLVLGIGLGQPPPAKAWILARKADTCLIMDLIKLRGSHMSGKLRQKPSSRDEIQTEFWTCSPNMELVGSFLRHPMTW